jgi:endonuclease/exonuclease/phosphatase family metal-dependent hydrolase
MTLTCVTYNILHGYHREKILENIHFLIKDGVDVICLQEVEVPFEAVLKEFLARKEFVGWQMKCAHAGFGGNVAILWRSGKLRYLSSRMVRLPKLRTASQLRKRMSRLRKYDTTRAALIGLFEAHGLIFQITSAHVAWEGGNSHRMRQLRHLRQELEKEKADVRIVAGDFNTLAPTALRRVHEKRVEHVLGSEYVNALPHLPWSYDISHADPSDGMGFLPHLHRAGVRFRARLDYIFATNVSVSACAMHDLPGSDHRPLVATFETLLPPTGNVLR